jgi:hypothetical protein
MNVYTSVTGLVFSTMVLLLVTACALCQSSSNVLAQSGDNNGIINVNQPLYSEHFKLTSQKTVVINGTKQKQRSLAMELQMVYTLPAMDMVSLFLEQEVLYISLVKLILSPCHRHLEKRHMHFKL